MTIYCATHRDNIRENGLFLHLRRLHGAERGGKLNLRRAGLDLRQLFIEMNSTNIRELLYRTMKSRFSQVSCQLKRLGILTGEEPMFYSKKVAHHQQKQKHIIVISLPDSIVTAKAIPIESMPFDVALNHFELVNEAIYIDDEPTELIIQSIPYTPGQLLGEVALNFRFSLI